jgi:CubicO group peptidase (beta-lactamase class C family)
MPIDTSKLEQQIQFLTPPFSGVLSIREQDRPIFTKAFGLADRSAGIANTTGTRFGIASGGKTFTAAAICQLVDQGKLTFDARIQDVLDIDFPHFDPAVSIHHLLTHTSGIPDYFDEEVEDDYAAVWAEHPNYSFRRAADFLPMFREKEMKFAPGARWAYSNAGYLVLGLVIEKFTGTDCCRYIEENVFAPAGMTDTGYYPLDRLPARTASGYIDEEDGGWHTNIYSIPIVGQADGGTFTTAADIGKFWDALLAGRLMSPATRELMFTPHQPRDDKGGSGYYGYGLWMEVEAGRTESISMVGEDPGWAFYSVLYPSRHVGLTLLANRVDSAWEALELAMAVVKE